MKVFRLRTRLALFAVCLLPLTTALLACGDDDPAVKGPAPRAGPNADLLPPEATLVGLEVTASGNVTEVLDHGAFRLDKDGADVVAPASQDPDFGEIDLAERSVLVLGAAETRLQEGDAVRVSGTVRDFHLREAEDVFNIELEPRLFQSYEEELVAVAAGVTKVPQDPGRSTVIPVPEPGDAEVADVGDRSLVGLEVATSGNVTEVLGATAFRLDKDGIGSGDTPVPEFDDDDFGDADLAKETVLVLDPRSTAGVVSGDAVQVTGTIRQFDLREVERIFEVDLDDRLFGPFHERLVIVADQVAKAGPPATAVPG